MSVEFLAIGFAFFFVFLSLKQRPQHIFKTISLIAFSISFLVFIIYLLSPHEYLNGKTSLNTSPWKEIILFTFMTLGMLARTLSKAIEERKTRMKKRNPKPEDASLKLDFWDISYPLLFSIPTYGAILSQIGDSNLNTASVVLAFETGFMWQTLLKSR